MPSGTPGLPQQLFGHTVRRRAKWIQLLVVNEQYRRSGFGFQFQLPGPRFLRQPRLRFSVALPLGINGECLRFAESRGPDASPREARNVRKLTASTPGRPTHQRYPPYHPTRLSNSIFPHFFRFRAARSEDGPKAQRAGPATLRVARTPPKPVGFILSP